MVTLTELLIAVTIVLLLVFWCSYCCFFCTSGEEHYVSLCALVGIFLMSLCVVLSVYQFQPKSHPPEFVLQNLNHNFNISHSNATLLNLSIEITLSSENPNHKTGIYYDTINIYASYMNQQVTAATILPATYQGHKEVTVWSPVLIGLAVPVSRDLSLALQKDLTGWMVPIDIKVDGWIRFKERWMVTGPHNLHAHHLHVNCPAFIWQESQQCAVELEEI